MSKEKTCFERFTLPIEREITTKLIQAILDAEADGGLVTDDGEEIDKLYIRVFDGEDLFPKPPSPGKPSPALRDIDQIKALLASTGSDEICIEQSDGHCIGGIVLIWGNGEDLISDYSTNNIIENICESIYQEYNA